MESVTTIVRAITPTTVGVWTLVVLGLAHFLREWRLTRKLTLDDRIARREGYAAQVESLMAENRNLREEMDRRVAALNRKYDGYREICEHEHEQHRSEILGLMDTIEGMRRERAAWEAAQLRREGQRDEDIAQRTRINPPSRRGR